MLLYENDTHDATPRAAAQLAEGPKACTVTKPLADSDTSVPTAAAAKAVRGVRGPPPLRRVAFQPRRRHSPQLARLSSPHDGDETTPLMPAPLLVSSTQVTYYVLKIFFQHLILKKIVLYFETTRSGLLYHEPSKTFFYNFFLM